MLSVKVRKALLLHAARTYAAYCDERAVFQTDGARVDNGDDAEMRGSRGVQGQRGRRGRRGCARLRKRIRALHRRLRVEDAEGALLEAAKDYGDALHLEHVAAPPPPAKLDAPPKKKRGRKPKAASSAPPPAETYPIHEDRPSSVNGAAS